MMHMASSSIPDDALLGGPLKFSLLMACAIFGVFSVDSTANADGLDFISGSYTNELHNINRAGSNYLHNRDNLNLISEAIINVNFSEKFLFHAVGTFDQVKDAHPNRDTYLQGHALRTKDIYFQYDDGKYGGQLGRITADFGTAWYLTPGLKATILDEDYAIWDKFGVTGWVRQNLGALGDVKVNASSFNTGMPNSFSLSFNGSNIPAMPGFTWHIAALDQAVDFTIDANGNRLPTSRDELGFAVGASQAFNITDNLRSTTLAEVVRFQNKGGVPNVGRTYSTIGESLAYGKWRLEGTMTLRSTDQPGTATITDNLITASIGYDFTKALSLDLGYQHAQFGSQYEDDVRSRLRYVILF